MSADAEFELTSCGLLDVIDRRRQAVRRYQKTLAGREAARRWRQKAKPWLQEHRKAYRREWERKQRENPEYVERDRETDRRWRHANRELVNGYNENWRRKDPAHSRAIILRNLARRRAARLGLEFSLDVKQIEATIREGVCQATGLPFDLSIGGGKKPWVPSLDRIDNNKGYTHENIRVTVFIFNLARNKFSDADLHTLCEAILSQARKDTQ